jgi:hypothetical protein
MLPLKDTNLPGQHHEIRLGLPYPIILSLLSLTSHCLHYPIGASPGYWNPEEAP